MEMFRKGDACATCRRNCFQMHRKKHDICSFFKIMFGETFNKLLVFPPIFSKKLKSLAETKMTLEDANKQCWDVYLSDVGGALTFRRGWRNFAVDHKIEMGDLLVFCYLGDSRFLVEIYGTSGCQKKFTFDGMNYNGISEEATNSLPKNRPSPSFTEQSPPKRYKPSYAFPRPNIDDTQRPKNVHVNVPSRGNIRESRPTVAPVAETFVNQYSMSREKDRVKVFPVPEPMVEPIFPEPVIKSSFRSNKDTTVESCSVINGDKKRPKMVPVPETLVDPCSMSNRDKSSPMVARLDETLVEPCFITTREETVEDDRNCLFDLSVFERPDKLSTIVKKDVTDCLVDFPVYGLPEKEAGADRSGGIPLLESGTFDNAVTEIADKKTTIERTDEKDYILDEFAFEKPQNECQLLENLLCQEPDHYQNAASEAALITFDNAVTEIADKNTTIERADEKDYILDEYAFEKPQNERQLLENLLCQEPDQYQNAASEAALITFPSCQITERKSNVEASGAGLHMDTIMPLTIIPPETAKLSALSGQNLRFNYRETRLHNQKVGGHVKREIFRGARISISEQNSGDLQAKNMRRVKQELIEFNQDLCGHATMKPVKIEENVNRFVKSEPADWDAPSALTVKAICSDSQDFLELPCLLPVRVPVWPFKSKTKYHQQLVFLRDPRKRLWPVLYHFPYGVQALGSGWISFMKANWIGPGDQCTFTLEDNSVDTFTVKFD